MPKEKTLQTEIGGFMSTLLRKHFGKGPNSVFVTIAEPFITIHFRGFISPIEKNLLNQNEWKRVLETRDLMLNELKPQILEELRDITKLDFTELYADWNLPLETGLLLGIMKEKPSGKNWAWQNQKMQKKFHEKIGQVHKKAEREPGRIESYWLNERTILVKRIDILVGIEEALIAEGYTELLKLIKRPLERKLLEKAELDKVLQRNIVETFLDWNFDEDFGFIVFVLETKSSEKLR